MPILAIKSECEIRKLSSEGGKPIAIDSLDIVNDYLVIIFDNKYSSKIFQTRIKSEKKVAEEDKKVIDSTVKKGYHMINISKLWSATIAITRSFWASVGTFHSEEL